MDRTRRWLLAGAAAGLGVAATAGTAAWLLAPERGWTRIPSTCVVSAPGDPRVAVAHAAVARWNAVFAEIGTPFHLEPAVDVVGTVPDADLQALSDQVPFRMRVELPPTAASFPGDLLIVLSDAQFISFAARGADGRALVGIKDGRRWPLTLPNVLPNVIAHELGHALGLAHNADPALLMCGRPAPCRPDAFASDTPRAFPLSEAELAVLRRLYPPDWAPRS